MPGQATVTIRDRQWLVDLATTYQEIIAGLGGTGFIPPGTGMLFDLGMEQIITVTTVPMLFPIDIVFISEELRITEIAGNVAPGYLVTPNIPARYFLEVNARETEGMEVGDLVTVEMYQLPVLEAPGPGEMVSQVIGLAATVMVFGLAFSLVKVMTRAILSQPKPKERPVLYGPKGERRLPKTRAKRRLTRDDVRVEVWEERDRLHIGIQGKKTGDYLVSWWDDEAREMFEQGFFKRGRGLEESVLDYAEEVGLLAPAGSGATYPPRATERRRVAGKYEIATDRMGNIILTHTERPGYGVFLQLEADKEMVKGLLRKGELRDLDEGWKVDVKDTEPRAGTLQELWEAAAEPEVSAEPPGYKGWKAKLDAGYGQYRTEYGREVSEEQVVQEVRSIPKDILRCYFRETLGRTPEYLPAVRRGLSVMPHLPPEARGDLLFYEYIRDMTRLGVQFSDEEARREWQAWDRRSSKPPAVTEAPQTRRPHPKEVEYFADSQEFLAYTIEDIGYRERIDSAFQEAILRAKGVK